MRQVTKERYSRGIEAAIALIGRRLDDPPGLEELARAARLSPFHFHRVYRTMTGETVAATTRRLRLARAAQLLSEAARTVTDIALEVGYESSQSFTKAFRAASGMSASEARRAPDALKAVAEALAKPSTGEVELPAVEIQVISLDPFEVAALRKVGPHADLYDTYRRLVDWAEARGLLAGLRGMWGEPQDDHWGTPEAERVFECCADLGPGISADAAAGIRVRTLGGGLWARARHVGPYEAIDAAYDRMYPAILALPDHEPDDRPLLNWYVDTPADAPPEQRRSDLHVPLRRTSAEVFDSGT
jgi:AraC family transcriptional regulator